MKIDIKRGRTKNRMMSNSSNRSSRLLYIAIIISVLGILAILFASFGGKITGKAVACNADTGVLELKSFDSGLTMTTLSEKKTGGCRVETQKDAKTLQHFLLLGKSCSCDQATGVCTLEVDANAATATYKLKSTGFVKEDFSETDANDPTKKYKVTIGCDGTNAQIDMIPLCAANADCAGGKVCKNNICEACTADADCGAEKVCANGVCGAGAQPPAECQANADCANGKVCKNNACAACAADADCGAGKVCTNGACAAVAPTCTDHIKNGAESDVDCGGNCGKCQLGKSCSVRDDCAVIFDCITNICTNRCTYNSECPDNAVCDTGKCKGDVNFNCAGMDNIGCKAGLVCQNDICAVAGGAAPVDNAVPNVVDTELSLVLLTDKEIKIGDNWPTSLENSPEFGKAFAIKFSPRFVGEGENVIFTIKTSGITSKKHPDYIAGYYKDYFVISDETIHTIKFLKILNEQVNTDPQNHENDETVITFSVPKSNLVENIIILLAGKKPSGAGFNYDDFVIKEIKVQVAEAASLNIISMRNNNVESLEGLLISCTRDADCTDIQYCSDGYCAQKKGSNTACVRDAQCLSNSCVGLKCIVLGVGDQTSGTGDKQPIDTGRTPLSPR